MYKLHPETGKRSGTQSGLLHVRSCYDKLIITAIVVIVVRIVSKDVLRQIWIIVLIEIVRALLPSGYARDRHVILRLCQLHTAKQ
ncbi:MAG: hypothetical protein OKBPIBMD_02197 [Chlorobi bacterium]|nr:hypothetical protein [Chlorobiota bacterium]